MKKITYIIINNAKAIETINNSKRAEDEVIACNFNSKTEDDLSLMHNLSAEAAAINATISEIKNLEDKLICIVPENSELKENFVELISPYLKETDNKVFLPMIELIDKKEEKLSFKGFLNATIWKSYIVAEAGELDHDAAMKQIDMSLYFAIIDGKLLQNGSENFNDSIPFFYQYNWLNTITLKEEISVLGIPKVVGYVIEPEEYQKASQEQKVEWFKLAQKLTSVATEENAPLPESKLIEGIEAEAK